MTKERKKLPEGKGETILIVDDKETIWDFLIEALQKLNYQVLLAGDGVDALEIYKNNPKQLDLVILDMIMPRMGGHETFSQIKSIDPDAKILLYSGHVSEEKVDDLIQRGAKGFLAKPHRLKDLAEEIRRIFDGEKK